jgi:hypothetical protein
MSHVGRAEDEQHDRCRPCRREEARASTPTRQPPELAAAAAAALAAASARASTSKGDGERSWNGEARQQLSQPRAKGGLAWKNGGISVGYGSRLEGTSKTGIGNPRTDQNGPYCSVLSSQYVRSTYAVMVGGCNDCGTRTARERTGAPRLLKGRPEVGAGLSRGLLVQPEHPKIEDIHLIAPTPRPASLRFGRSVGARRRSPSAASIFHSTKRHPSRRIRPILPKEPTMRTTSYVVLLQLLMPFAQLAGGTAADATATEDEERPEEGEAVRVYIQKRKPERSERTTREGARGLARQGPSDAAEPSRTFRRAARCRLSLVVAHKPSLTHSQLLPSVTRQASCDRRRTFVRVPVVELMPILVGITCTTARTRYVPAPGRNGDTARRRCAALRR